MPDYFARSLSRSDRPEAFSLRPRSGGRSRGKRRAWLWGLLTAALLGAGVFLLVRDGKFAQGYAALNAWIAGPADAPEAETLATVPGMSDESAADTGPLTLPSVAPPPAPTPAPSRTPASTPATATPVPAAAPAGGLTVSPIAAPAPAPVPAPVPVPASVSPAQAAPAVTAVPSAVPARAASAQPAALAAPTGSLRGKAELKSITGLLGTDPAAARQRLDRFVADPANSPADLADAWYLVGYLAIVENREGDGEGAWERAALDYPEQRGGRLAALTLADRWYARFVEATPRRERYEEIWRLYSTAFGEDRGARVMSPQASEQTRQRLMRLVDQCVFGRAPMQGETVHKLGNEYVGQVARKYGVSVERIGLVNHIDPNRVRPGQELKIVPGTVRVVVHKNRANPGDGPRLTWFLDGKWMREYPACVGPEDKTPAGEYTVSLKQLHPDWWHEGQRYEYGHPENILGTHWIAMKGNNTTGLGIHGTTLPNTVPGYSSAGCVRLHNANVEELYAFASVGTTTVAIRD